MANGDQLKALLRSFAEGDDRHFYSIAMQLAAHEAKQGHGKLAEELRVLIDAAKTRRHVTGTDGPIPISRPKGELATLLSVSYPSRRLSDMVLSQPLLQALQRVLKEQRHLSKLRNHGLHPRRKLLLVGPSGTGKTMTASAIAGKLGIPLFVVRLDVLITKFMGETAAKLRQVFDAAAATRGVYFFDEFDAIGSQRYRSDFRMIVEEAQDYHFPQLSVFAKCEADMAAAFTMTYLEEAIGIVRAAAACSLPVVISFTLETDGCLPSGCSLEHAIRSTDDQTGAYVAYYMINCAHPTHFKNVLFDGGDWVERLRGLRANASRLSHAELDEATSLDDGNPHELGQQYNALRQQLPHMTVMGGCCGTDHRHVEEIGITLAQQAVRNGRVQSTS